MTTRALGRELSPNPQGLVEQPHIQSNASATGLALTGAVTTTIANFGVAVLVSRVSAAFAGIFFATTAVVTILGNSSGLGTMTGLVYFLPSALAAPRPNPRALLVLALGPVLAVGIASALAVSAGAGAVAGAVAAERADEVAEMLRLLALVIPFWAVTVTLLGATRGLGTMTPTVVANQVVRPLGQLVLIAGVLLADPTPSGSVVAAAWGLPVVAASVVALLAVSRLGGLSSGGPPLVGRREFWCFTRPRSLSTTFQIALERIDVILVSALAGEAAAGVYGTITRFVTAGNFLIFAMSQATSGALRRALVAGRVDRAQRLLRQSTGWMVLVTWPYFLLLATKAEPLITVLNADFVGGAPALSLLGVAMLAGAFAGPIDLTLLMLGRSRWALSVTAVALAVDVGVAWFAIPAFGLVGAAAAWGAAVVVQNVMASVLVRVTGGLTAIARPSLTAAAAASLAVVPIGLVTPPDLAGLVSAAIVAVLALALMVVATAPLLDLDIGPVRAVRSAISARSRTS